MLQNCPILQMNRRWLASQQRKVGLHEIKSIVILMSRINNSIRLLQFVFNNMDLK